MDIGNIQLTDKEIQAGNINIPVIKGAPGKDGYTPVKGKDYWTTQDKEEIVQEINQDVNDKLEAKADKIDVETQLDTKVDKEEGKGLSEENFTKEDKQKLENIVPETTKSLQGTSFHMPDSAEAPMKISPRGNDIVQDTREGHNLFNVNDTNTVSSGITVDEEDWITITCDNSSGTSIIYQNYFTNNLNLKENTNYNIIAEIKKVSGTGNIQIVSSSSASQFNQSMGYLFSNLSNGQTVQLNKLTKSDFTNTTQGIRTFCSFNAGESGSITFRISVLEDTTITSDNFVYVKFGKSPSLNYPSELKYVGGNYDIEVSNRNIWIPTLTNKDVNIKAVNCTVELNDDIYKFTATDSDMYFGAVFTTDGINYVKSAGTLYKIKNHKTLSILITNATFNKNYIEFYDKDKKTISYLYKTINNFKIDIPTNAEYFVMRIGKGDSVSGTVYETKIDVRLDEDLINDYIKHEGEIYPLDLINHPLYSNKDYIYKKNNKLYVHNEWNKIILDGTINKFEGKSGSTTNNLFITRVFSNLKTPVNNGTVVKHYSNCFLGTYSTNELYSNDIIGSSIRNSSEFAIGFGLDSGIDTLELANAKLQELYNAGTPVEIIYPLATPTETEITDKKVIAQLEELYNTYAYDEVTNISVDNPILSAELVLDVLYYQKTALGLETKVSYEEYSKLLKRVEELENVILTLGGTI